MKKPFLVILIIGAVVLALIISGLAMAVFDVSPLDLFSKDSSSNKPSNNTTGDDNTPAIARIIVMDSDMNVSYDKTFEMNEVIWFDATSSTGSGNISRYKWDFGDGMTQEGSGETFAKLNHTYSEKGPYVVSLMVTARNNAKASTNVTLTILGLPYTNSQMYLLSTRLTSNATCNFDMEKDALNMTINVTATGISQDGAGKIAIEVTDPFGNTLKNQTIDVMIQGMVTFYFDAPEISAVGTYFINLDCEKGTMRVIVDINVLY